MTLFFCSMRYYNGIMSKKINENGGEPTGPGIQNPGIQNHSTGKGPWDGPSDDDSGKIPPKGGRAKSGPRADPPESNSDGPRNPWAKPSGEGSEPPRPRSASLDDLLRRAGGGGGGKNGGFTGLPRRPNGKSYLPLIAAAIGIIWFLATSVHQLDTGEEGVITRFGKYSRTVGSGISMTLPSPIEKLTKVDTQELRYTMVGSPQASAENLVLTKDSNLIDMAYQISWNVRDPERFLFQLEESDDGNRDGTVKAVAESAMRETIANFDYDVAVGPGRLDVEAGVRTRMQKILDGYGSGIRIQGVAIKQSDPPEETKEAFNRVSAAKQKRESNLSNARAYASQVTQRAEGDTGEFDRIYVQYKEAPEVTKRRLYYETMESILGKMDKTIAESGNVQPYLALPELKKRAAAAAPTPAPEAKAKEPAQ
jgi:modulator of FtsH protease HflK